MKNIKEFFISASVLGLIGIMVVWPAVWAADEATVVATVTLQNISLQVSDGNVNYGTMAASSTKSTCTSELNDLQVVTNDGNVAENFNIRGQDSTNWSLGSSPGTNIYVHEFSTSTCSTWPGGIDLATSTYKTMATNVATSTNVNLNLRIITPTSSSVYTQQSVDVTLQAVAY